MTTSMIRDRLTQRAVSYISSHTHEVEENVRRARRPPPPQKQKQIQQHNNSNHGDDDGDSIDSHHLVMHLPSLRAATTTSSLPSVLTISTATVHRPGTLGTLPPGTVLRAGCAGVGRRMKADEHLPRPASRTTTTTMMTRQHHAVGCTCEPCVACRRIRGGGTPTIRNNNNNRSATTTTTPSVGSGLLSTSVNLSYHVDHF
eukprot:PhM_4_TR18961/c0_g2_i1/m.39086